jgi:ABC-type transport system substrate-binding protein
VDWLRAIALLTIGLAGCTNNPYPDADARAKVLYLSYPIAPKTLDPAVGYSVYDAQVTGNIFGTLFEYDYLERPYRLIPALAEAVPRGEPTAAGHVAYRFALRPGVLFQDDDCFALDGSRRRTRAVTAADVVFALNRLADPEVGSPVVDTFGKLDGFREFAERLRALRAADPDFAALRIDAQYARAGGIAGVRALSETELEIVLREAYPQILYWFAMPFTAPQAWEAVATYDGRDGRDNLADHPVGTGPFRLTRYERLNRIVLERNPNWYGVLHPEWRAPGTVYPSSGTPADAAAGLLAADVVGRPLPFLDRIELRREPESVPAFMKFMQGYYDQSPIVRESFDRTVQHGTLTADLSSRGLQLGRVVEATVYYLGFNMDDPVVGAAAGARSRALRQAMSLAIDGAEFLRIFNNGRGVAAQSPLPPDIFGYDPGYRNPYRSVDLARAAALLAMGGYPNGIDPASGQPLRLTLDVNDTSSRALLMFEFFRDSWKRLGLDVEVTATDYNAFQDKMRRGAYQVYWWGWGADYPDPENFLFLLYGPMGRTRSGGPNDANFADPRYDQLFVRMRARENDPERAALIAEMRAILERECPWIPVFHREQYTLSQPWLQHAKPSALTLPTEKYLDLDPGARAELRAAWNQPLHWPAYALAAAAAAFIAPAPRRAWRESRR